ECMPKHPRCGRRSRAGARRQPSRARPSASAGEVTPLPPAKGGPLRENKVKRVLRQGGVALGTMVMEFNTSGIARLAAEAGADFILFDMEHTGWSVETVRTLLASARCADIVPMVRVPATQYHFLARVLDMGALGVMVPMV